MSHERKHRKMQFQKILVKMSQHTFSVSQHNIQKSTKRNVATFSVMSQHLTGPLRKIMKLRTNNYFYMSRQSIKEGTNPREVVVATFNEGHNKIVGL